MYDAFISYSQKTDSPLAAGLQRGLEKFARPWNKIRSVSIFRDGSSLSASPDLWYSIQQALDQSTYLIVMASPASAQSVWVEKEIQHWLTIRSPQTIIIALTAGELYWQESTKTFIDGPENSLPPILRDQYNSEPHYVDLRHLHAETDYSLKNAPFRKAVLQLAAPLHNKEPRELESEELTQYRRTKRIRNTVFVAGGLLLGLAGIGMMRAYKNEQQRKAQQTIAESAAKRAKVNRLLSEAKTTERTDPTIALRLAEQAYLVDHDSTAESEMLRIYKDNYFYKVVAKISGPVDRMTVAADHALSAVSADGIAYRIDKSGKLSDSLKVTKEDIDPFTTAISPDGRFIFLHPDGAVPRLWDTQQGGVKMLMRRDSAGNNYNDISNASFSPDSKRLLLGHYREENELWDVNGNFIKAFKDSSYANFYVFWKRGGGILQGDDGFARVLDPDGNELRRWKTGKGMIKAISCSQDSRFFLTSSDYHEVKLWDDQLNLVAEYPNFKADVASMDFSPDGNEFVVCCNGGVFLCDLEGKVIQTFKTSDDEISFAQFSPDGQWLFTGSGNGSIMKWFLKDKVVKNVQSIYARTGKAITDIRFLDSGHELGFTYQDVDANGEITGSLDEENLNPEESALAASPDSSLSVVSVSEIKFQLLGPGKKLLREFVDWTERANASPYRAIRFFGDKVFIGAVGDTAFLCNRNGDILHTFVEPVDSAIRTIPTAACFSPDGEKIAIGYEDGSVYVWDIAGNSGASLKQVSKEPEGFAISCILFGPGQSYIITGTENSDVQLWDEQGKLVREFKNDIDVPVGLGILEIFFMPGNLSFFTSWGGPTARLWDLQGHLLQQFEGYKASIGWEEEDYSFELSPDKEYILGQNEDRSHIYLFRVNMPLQKFLDEGNVEPLSTEQKEKYGIG